MSEAEQGYVWVTAAKYNGITKDETKLVDEQTNLKVPNFNGLPVARVTVSGGTTKNLGNFESARIGVEISLPCYPVEEEIVRVYGELQELVGEMVSDQMKAFDPVK